MTAIAAARITLYTEYATNVTAVTYNADATLSEVTFENESYDPPVGVPWVRLAVRHFGAAQESLGDAGNRKYNRAGQVQVQVFLPEDEGVGLADPIVQEIIEIFEGKTLTGVRTFTAESREIGLIDGYWLATVDIPFEYTETR